jgi:hypothetical protein
MPRSRSSRDESWNISSQDVNLAVCLERERPISVRKVAWSGTKGMGAGMGGRRMCTCRHRRQRKGRMGGKGEERSFRVIILEEIGSETRGSWWMQLLLGRMVWCSMQLLPLLRRGWSGGEEGRGEDNGSELLDMIELIQ